MKNCQLAASSNEREEADEAAKEIGRHAESVEVEEGTKSVSASGNSDNLSKKYSFEPRYPRREHEARVRLTINALKRVRKKDEHRMKEALEGLETKQW